MADPLVVRREVQIAAPPSTVFAFLTDPEKIERWLGTEPTAEPHPGVPPSPAELAELFRRMRDARVPIIIADPYANPALIRQVEEKSGAKAVRLLPSGFDYIELFEENVKRLSAALKKG